MAIQQNLPVYPHGRRSNLHAELCPNGFLSHPSKPDPHAPLLAAYLDHLRHVRGLEPKTCEGHLVAARRVLAWYDAHVPGQPIATMTGEHVLAVVEHLLALSSNDYTRTSITSYIRTFLRFLRWSDLNSQDLARFVPRTPCYRLAHLPPRLPWDDVRRAIDAISTATPTGVRNRAILLLLATTGLRNKELRSLELQDIHWRAPKCSCVKPRPGAIASCRSYRKLVRRLPSMSCMPGLGATAGASSYSISRLCAPSTRAASFPGSCDLHWSAAGSSFPVSLAPI